MNIVWFTPSYIPYRRAGSEVMTASVVEYLISRGHKVTLVVVKDDKKKVPSQWTGEYGEEVFSEDATDLDKLLQQGDVVFCHLGASLKALELARKHSKPLVHWHHVYEGFTTFGLKSQDIDLLVHNSEWMKSYYLERCLVPRQTVCIPPVWVQDYETERDSDYITLINLTESKGVGLFKYLARQRPQWNFLGVLGGYGVQEYRSMPSNVLIVENTSNMKEIYAKTGVLLCPSAKETWGRVAIEAMCSGIPVIGAMTEGLIEAIGYGGYVADRNKPDLWLSLLDRLMNEEEFYELSSKNAHMRAYELESMALDYLTEFEAQLNVLIQDQQNLHLPPLRQETTGVSRPGNSGHVRAASEIPTAVNRKKHHQSP